MMPALHKPARARIEAKIESLISFLDELDGDPDLEADADREDEGHDEPSLGGAGHWTDAGLQHDLEDDQADKEPSLGRLETDNQGPASYVGGWITDGEVGVDDEGEPEDGQ